MNDADAEILVASFYRHYNSHDVAAVGALYAEDGAHEDIAGGKRREGRQSVESGLAGFFSMLPDVAFAIENTVFSREAAVVFYRMTGHIGRDFGTMPTKGKPIALAGVHVFALEAGRIKATTDFWNEADFKRQLAA
jgi:steroid delta-isomerase-like uncharacterized protein